MWGVFNRTRGCDDYTDQRSIDGIWYSFEKDPGSKRLNGVYSPSETRVCKRKVQSKRERSLSRVGLFFARESRGPHCVTGRVGMRACLYGVCKCRETAEIDGRSAESFNCRNYNHRFVGEDKQPREKEFLNSHHQLTLCSQ